MSRHTLPGEFFCLRCGVIVSGAFELSGVRNRNHCPYCLWSRHLDWQAPGDRLSSCKGAMRPIGLTLKNARKKYAAVPSGELMVVHQCVVCAAVSINRIAADDGTGVLVEVFRTSLMMEYRIHTGLETGGVRILNRSDWEVVSRRLFGEYQPVDAALPPGG
ncbi:MAG: RNHCP domain-containing protein [Anaerolineales bacterium]|nr:RNHCP domain-containing protein [Anaerolineales bacterium]